MFSSGTRRCLCRQTFSPLTIASCLCHTCSPLDCHPLALQPLTCLSLVADVTCCLVFICRHCFVSNTLPYYNKGDPSPWPPPSPPSHKLMTLPATPWLMLSSLRHLTPLLCEQCLDLILSCLWENVKVNHKGIQIMQSNLQGRCCGLHRQAKNSEGPRETLPAGQDFIKMD